MAPSAAPSTKRTLSSTSGRRAEDEELRPYVIVGDLGKGSFAVVYKGYHEETREEVAIKTVSRSSLSAKLFENLQSEIDILKSLSHRHITKLIDIIRAERNIYLIMEFCAGGDLTNYIKKRGRVEGLEYVPSPGAAPQYYPHPRTGGLAEIVVRSFLRQLARALKFLRGRNLIHRDIKPQNLLLKPASEDELRRGHPLGVPILKIADFGFARLLPEAMMAETLCGSPLYMAPEILSYQKYDAKADLWSVGAVLYEMSVGRPPFRAANHIELLKKIDHSKGIRFPDEDPAAPQGTTVVPDDVKKLIRMLLRRVPVERASFEEFFKSTALANSKFPRPARPAPVRVESAAAEHADGAEADEDADAVPGVIPEAHMRIPPEVLDPQAMIPPSRFNFRRASNPQGELEETSAPAVTAPVPTRDAPRPPAPAPAPTQTLAPQAQVEARVHTPPQSANAPASRRALSTEGSIIPGETEEDGLLRREYVLVGDTRAVEFNRTVDEINAARRRPLLDRRVPPTPPNNVPSASGSPSSSSPHELDAHPAADSASPNTTTFPPPPNANATPPPPLTRTPTNALTRALSLASRRLFGSSGAGTGRSPPPFVSSSPPRVGELRDREAGAEREKEKDPVEDALLARLEQLAQKTDVITRWADEMYEYVKAIPQKPLPDPSKFAPREGEPEKLARRRKHADTEAEYNAVTCVAIYMLVMSFSQKGIEELRRYQEHMEMRFPAGDFEVSEGFDQALGWFKDHFVKCNDRAALVKTWLPAQYTGPSTWVDELVYNRALTLSRNAAHKELLDQHKSPDECEKLYEESLWCLYALQDDLLQKGNPFMEEDRETIATWIKRTKLRLVRCRARMAMPIRERLRDARADKNLDDVPRIPAPWDAEGMQALQNETLGQNASPPAPQRPTHTRAPSSNLALGAAS